MPDDEIRLVGCEAKHLLSAGPVFQKSTVDQRKNQPFRSNSTAFILATRTVYARIRCEQTTAFELLKLLQ